MVDNINFLSDVGQGRSQAMHFSEHTIFPFPEDSSAVHPEDICFLLIYVMDMTVKESSIMDESVI